MSGAMFGQVDVVPAELLMAYQINALVNAANAQVPDAIGASGDKVVLP